MMSSCDKIFYLQQHKSYKGYLAKFDSLPKSQPCYFYGYYSYITGFLVVSKVLVHSSCNCGVRVSWNGYTLKKWPSQFRDIQRSYPTEHRPMHLFKPISWAINNL